jgi:hypothetical protein
LTDHQLAAFAYFFALIGISLLLCHLPPVKRLGAGLGLIVVAILVISFTAIAFILAKIIA